MSKSTVVRTWLGGVIALAGGLAVVGVSIGLMLAYGGSFTQAPSGQGYDFEPALTGFFWTTVWGIVLGCFVAAVGGIVQLVAWIGALANTFQLPDKTWFAVLLACGVLGFAFGVVGLAGMLAYVIAGPDGAKAGRQLTPIGQQPKSLAATT